MIEFKTKTIEDKGQTRLTNGVMSNVEFSGFTLEVPEEKNELFLDIYDAMKQVKDLVDASMLIQEMSLDFKANDPRIKKFFELIQNDTELVGDILSFIYNRVGMESGYIAGEIMKKIKKDDGEDTDKESTLNKESDNPDKNISMVYDDNTEEDTKA